MDFLKAEIARKKKLMEETKLLKAADSETSSGSKYFKRGELNRKQVYWEPSDL